MIKNSQSMTYKENEKYECVFTSEVHGVSFYMPKEVSEYTTARYVKAGEQEIYSQSGATKELMQAMMQKQLQICNTGKKDTIITDCATIANNILFRLQYPVDQDCALRMAAIYLLTDGEEMDDVSEPMIAKKLTWCKGGIDAKGEKIAGDDKMYRFFLSMGIENTQSWAEYRKQLEGNYFVMRNENLLSLTLQ